MKTKLIFLIIGFTVSSLFLTAGIPPEISKPDALTAARKLLTGLGKQNTFTMGETREIKKVDQLLAFVFDLDPPGYIVVGASTDLPPVIAYSFESNFGSMDEDNPLFTLLKKDLAGRSVYAVTPGNSMSTYYLKLWESILSEDPVAKAYPLFEQWPATGDGWLKTNWTQNAPYNNFCPLDPVSGTRSYAGCPATAMAQIMNFHETTNNTRFNDTDDYYHNYAGRQYWIDDDHEAIDFPGFPELNIYLDTLDAHYLAATALTPADKAALTFACGTAARQVYTSQGSGTFGVDQAYDAYLRFGCNSVALLDAGDADLYERLKQNIIDTLPAHLAVVDESWSTGHNVVVDGYNTDDYYHLNFGWGGAYNGWYLLPEEIPYELTVIEGVVVDIMKKTPVGIGESAVSSRQLVVEIYPNPADDLITVEILAFCSGFQVPGSGFQVPGSRFQISIFDFQGREILERQIIAPQTVVEVSGLNPGVYFVKVLCEDGIMVGKFVKQ